MAFLEWHFSNSIQKFPQIYNYTFFTLSFFEIACSCSATLFPFPPSPPLSRLRLAHVCTSSPPIQYPGLLSSPGQPPPLLPPSLSWLQQQYPTTFIDSLWILLLLQRIVWNLQLLWEKSSIKCGILRKTMSKTPREIPRPWGDREETKRLSWTLLLYNILSGNRLHYISSF